MNFPYWQFMNFPYFGGKLYSKSACQLLAGFTLSYIMLIFIYFSGRSEIFLRSITKTEFWADVNCQQ